MKAHYRDGSARGSIQPRISPPGPPSTVPRELVENAGAGPVPHLLLNHTLQGWGLAVCILSAAGDSGAQLKLRILDLALLIWLSAWGDSLWTIGSRV